MRNYITTEDFIIFIIETGWIKQYDFADCIEISESTVSRNIKKAKRGEGFSLNLVNALLDNSNTIAKVLFEYRKKHGTFSMVNTIRKHFDLLPQQTQIVNALVKQEETKEQVALFQSLIETLQSRKVQRNVPKTWDNTPVVNDFIRTGDPKEGQLEKEMEGYRKKFNAIDSYRALIINDEKEEIVNVSDDARHIMHSVSQTINLVKCKGSFVLKIGFGSRQTNIEVVDIGDFDIKINGISASSYCNVADPKSLIEKAGLPSRQWEAYLNIPLLTDDTIVQITLKYTFICKYQNEGIANSFFINLPCKELDHSYILQGKTHDCFEILVTPFFSFYECNKPHPVSTRFDNAVVIVKCNDWEMPGSGYVRFIRKK